MNWNFFKRPVFIIYAFIAVIVIIAGYFYFSSGQKGPEYIVATKGNITELVSITGKVKPVQNVDLAFKNSGKISAVYADVGNHVGVGDVIAREDSAELQSQLDKANADLAVQQAMLDKDKIILGNDYSSIPNILNDSYTKSDDAVRNQADTMFVNPETDNPQLSFSSNDSQSTTDARNGRLASRAELIAWKQEIGNLDLTSNNALYQELIKAQNHLSVIRTFLVRLMDALNQAFSLSSSTASTYKTAVITGRGEVNTAFTNITNQIQTIDSQNATIISDNASVQSYVANINNIKAQISQSILYAPISGVVTRQDAKVGQIASAGANLISIISSSQFEVEADVPEVDIAKVKIGSQANITLDAYGNGVVFEAKVSKIDPAETIIEGVSTYKTTLQFLNKDDRIKSGLTGNVDIVVGQHSGAIIIPARFVWSKDNNKFVTIIGSNGRSADVAVTTGLRGSDGSIEIISGLKEGDRVIVHPKQ